MVQSLFGAFNRPIVRVCVPSHAERHHRSGIQVLVSLLYEYFNRKVDIGVRLVS